MQRFIVPLPATQPPPVIITPPPTSVYAHFFALSPDGPITQQVFPGFAISFPHDGPMSAIGISRSSASEFSLETIGTYEIHWQATMLEPGQLVLVLDGSELNQTVVGRETIGSQMQGHAFITTTLVNSLLSVRVSSASYGAMNLSVNPGGTMSVTATLSIKKL